jgi:hypothetical protein
LGFAPEGAWYVAIETAADQKERLTNRYQAYEFMKTVEDTSRKL